MRTGRFGLVALGALCAALLLAATASAATPEFKSTFSCGDGVGANPQVCGAFESIEPDRLAVNEASGDVYVIDRANAAVDRFSAAGAYLGQFTGADTTGGEPFAFANDSDIAVDNSSGPNQGTVYLVTEGGECNSACGVYAFDPSGAFLWEKVLSGDPCGVAVDPAGNLWTADFSAGVQQRSLAVGAEGEPVGSSVAVTGNSCEIAFDSQSSLYLREWGFDPIVKLAAPAYDLPTAVVSGNGMLDIAVNLANDSVLAPQKSENVVYAYDSTGGALSGTPFSSSAAGREYVGVAVNAAAGKLYVTDAFNKDVEVYDLVRHTLTVTPAGAGTGTVEADVGAIAGCSSGGGTCSDVYEADESVTLTATPGAHSVLTWSGCPLELGDECLLSVESDTTVTATFALETHALSVTKAGSGSGSVTCNGGPCAASYPYGTALTLAASPASGSSFAGWSGGGCSGTGSCTLTLNADTALTATFTANPAGGGGGGSTPAPTPSPAPSPAPAPSPKPLKCKKGFKKKTVKGKARCVKAKKHHGHKRH